MSLLPAAPDNGFYDRLLDDAFSKLPNSAARLSALIGSDTNISPEALRLQLAEHLTAQLKLYSVLMAWPRRKTVGDIGALPASLSEEVF
ncbi:hypothetical protein FHS91_002499 [Sphingobium xanthum]|uniref:hypothetical protein n=1 Tax=Sphingobium xanthum TaxID=1387165 RepID=UPI001C8CB645|nr:hypothetical protein [Sphingobium xanthum]